MLQKNCSCVKMSLTFPVWDSMTAIPSSYKCVVLSLTGQLLDVCTEARLHCRAMHEGLWFFMVLFGFLWFFNRLIFSSHRWGMMKISFPWWKPPLSDFRHHLTCGPNRFSVFFECFSQLLMVFHGLFGFLSFSTVSFFHHIVGGWWKSRFLDEDRLRHTVEKSG